MHEFDLLIKDCVVDGSGAPRAYKGSLGITGERIAMIGDMHSNGAVTVIDAENLIVAPGLLILAD